MSSLFFHETVDFHESKRIYERTRAMARESGSLDPPDAFPFTSQPGGIFAVIRRAIFQEFCGICWKVAFTSLDASILLINICLTFMRFQHRLKSVILLVNTFIGLFCLSSRLSYFVRMFRRSGSFSALFRPCCSLGPELYRVRLDHGDPLFPDQFSVLRYCWLFLFSFRW